MEVHEIPWISMAIFSSADSGSICYLQQTSIYLIIDREAGEIMHLVASMCLSVCLSVCPSSPV